MRWAKVNLMRGTSLSEYLWIDVQCVARKDNRYLSCFCSTRQRRLISRSQTISLRACPTKNPPSSMTWLLAIGIMRSVSANELPIRYFNPSAHPSKRKPSPICDGEKKSARPALFFYSIRQKCILDHYADNGIAFNNLLRHTSSMRQRGEIVRIPYWNAGRLKTT